MSATDRLKIYNGALLLCGEKELASLSESREPRRLLDRIWNDNGVRFCLEQAQWHFAMRSSQLEYDTGVAPDWGYSRAHAKPTDWVLTSGVFSDEFMRTPLTDYADEAGHWFSFYDTIYVRYVSDDTAFGLDYAKWPATFIEYVKAYFAGKIVHKLPNSKGRIEYLNGPTGRPQKGYVHQCLVTAKNRCAMAQPTTFPTRGTWSAARSRGYSRNPWRDGGNQNSLIG
jgi:hypothetical protein